MKIFLCHVICIIQPDIDEMLMDCEIVTPADVPNDLEIDIMDDEDDDDLFPVRVSSKG